MNINGVYINAKAETDRLYVLSIKGDDMTDEELAEAAALIRERAKKIRDGQLRTLVASSQRESGNQAP